MIDRWETWREANERGGDVTSCWRCGRFSRDDHGQPCPHCTPICCRPAIMVSESRRLPPPRHGLPADGQPPANFLPPSDPRSADQFHRDTLEEEYAALPPHLR